MYKERFERTKSYITASPVRSALFTFVYKYLPAAVFVSYPALLGFLLFTKDTRLIACVAVPLFMFVTLSAARHLLDLPRPYEKYDITPIIAKDKTGHSFPSRHTASAAAVAAAFWYVSLPFGIAMMAAAVLIGASRVIGGVHFFRDVAAGFLYALLCGAVYFFI